jgi:hypothetical protein
MAKVLIAMNRSKKAQQRFEHDEAFDPASHIAHYILATLLPQSRQRPKRPKNRFSFV